MAIGESVGSNTGQNTGSSGNTYVGVTPVINSISADSNSLFFTVNFNTGIKTDSASFATGFTLLVNNINQSIFESDVTNAGNGILILGTNSSFAEGDALSLIYTDSTGGINSVLGDIQLANQTATYTVPVIVIGDIFFDDFETGDWSGATGGYWSSTHKNTFVSTLQPKTGSYSLRYAFNEINNSRSAAEQRFFLNQGATDLWIKFDLYIPSNYFHTSYNGTASNNKFVLISGGGIGGEPGDSILTRIGPKHALQLWAVNDGGFGRARVDIYASGYRDGVVFQGYFGSGVIFQPGDFGHWMQIVTHHKYASSANNDGICELWKTDYLGVQTKILDTQNGAWYTNNLPNTGWDLGYLMGTANSHPTLTLSEEVNIYMDNITFSTTSLL